MKFSTFLAKVLKKLKRKEHYNRLEVSLKPVFLSAKMVNFYQKKENDG